MEISGNKYLHKKFKKQTNFPVNNVITITNAKVHIGNIITNQQQKDDKNEEFIINRTETKTETIQNQKTLLQQQNFEKEKIENNYENEYQQNNRFIENNLIINDNVPNLKSTNNEYLEEKYNSINLVLNNHESSISENKIILLENSDVNPVSLNIISRNEPNLYINNELKENHFNFDTKLTNNTHHQIFDKSSEYSSSKYNLLSERQPNNLDERNLLKNDEITQPENNDSTSIKKLESGGKYVCTYCNLACSKPSVLQKHIRAHTNERPYPCVSCGFSFKTRSNLYKHCRSRTHANRVMGNKHQENSIELNETESQEKLERFTENVEIIEQTQPEPLNNQINSWEQKTKPYKPKFHTAKLFFDEENSKNNEKNDYETKNNNNDLLKLRINELINKNNSIVNSDEAILIRRKNIENGYDREYSCDIDEPLNLSAKNRKRCLSETSENSVTDRSLIKQLLLKNLNPDPDLQCQYCKMLFQSVPELEMHKLKYCTVHNNKRYVRSSSVNVASILNKNSYENPTALPLKSPGPFLGKTRLIENDKTERFRTFSFDDNAISLTSPQPESPMSKYMLQSPSFSPISPLKKNSVKLFGGEVKITQTSGETRSFKIESETSMNKIGGDVTGYDDYNSKLSENLVIKSSLGSGGTVLQSKPTYQQKNINLPSPSLIRYDNSNQSPKLNIPILKTDEHYNFEKSKEIILAPVPQRKSPNIRENSPLIKNYEEKDFKTNLIDFSQKAIKLITPNLKPPNLTIPGLPIPMLPITEKYSPTIDFEKDKTHLDNINFAKKQISLQQKMNINQETTNLYNPVNLLVEGKVVRYVPGMPGPVETSLDLTPKLNKSPKEPPKIPYEPKNPINGNIIDLRAPTIIIDQPEPPNQIQDNLKMQVISKIKMDFERREVERSKRENEKEKISLSPIEKSNNSEVRKFVRPNSLALKPSSVAFKQHHGLTPTMFNQALISPDTPRVAKKFVQQYLNGNYFSYLGLKSSTKSVYCTLNKTQPFYVKHFKKLSMYSEWRQQESKIDSLSVSAYDSRQRQNKYTLAGNPKADLMVHSSYKFVISECPIKDDNVKNSVPGGYESNENYTYIRGRGRGRYVCDQCGIRCKKPSMLKKHLRTHSDDRPYTCEHCNFSFKTKGNLTKHMKSKAHTKKFSETSTPNTNSGTSSESDDSDAESSDESTRLQEQEHEAAHCLLSLSQKGTPPPINSQETSSSSFNLNEYPIINDDSFLKNPEQITQVNNTNFAKNKILNEPNLTFTSKQITDVIDITESEKHDNFSQYFGKTSLIRPLTYPYQKNIENTDQKENSSTIITSTSNNENFEVRLNENEKFVNKSASPGVIKIIEKSTEIRPKTVEEPKNLISEPNFFQNFEGNLPANVLIRKRKLSGGITIQNKVLRPEEQQGGPINLSNTPVLDLSSPLSSTDVYKSDSRFVRRDDEVTVINNFVQKNQFLSIPKKTDDFQNEQNPKQRTNSFSSTKSEQEFYGNYERGTSPLHKQRTSSYPGISRSHDEIQNIDNQQINTSVYQFSSSKSRHSSFSESNSSETFSQNSESDRKQEESIENPNVIYKSVNFDSNNSVILMNDNNDQSAMQTLADIAIKQMKNEKNILAKNVASVYLKLTTKNENSVSEVSDGVQKFNKESDMIVKSEENKSCTICLKNFSKPSQLRLHMNIHYLERPYRCEPCSVSFRTKGHLQKHERSASHHNKLSSSPALSSSEPRPFKCTDCNIAFRIHGHLAKHLRSKMHIMKLECLAKIPFGLYAELERANSLLTEINTTDGELCLESLKILARKLFTNDPNKLDQIPVQENRDS